MSQKDDFFGPKTAVELLMTFILTPWSTREPFWRRIERMSPERRALLNELKSDDIKDHIWLFRK